MLFSIIVPVYKVEKYLKNCIESIQNQSFLDYEVILVDDGSPDNSPQICDRYASEDARISVIHKNNGGVVSARNAGIAKANGQYILFVDADDWIAENMLKEIADIIYEYHAPDTVLFDAYRVFTDRQERMPQFLEAGYYDKERLNKEIVPSMLYDKKQPFLTAMIIGQLWNKAIKADILREHHCKDESLYKSEDYACVYECIYFSDSLYYKAEPLYYYNKTNEGSAMTKYDVTYFRNHDKVMRYTKEHLGVHSDELMTQIHACNVSGICIGVFHEMRHGRGLLEARRHIKGELESTTCLKEANCKGLPIHAKVFIFLLKHKLYWMALVLAKVYLLL